MNDINPEALVPNIVMKDSIEAEGSGYYVELGEQRFSQQQWELVQLYAQGVANVEVQNHEDSQTRSASMQDMVKHFHEGMGQPVGLAPHPLPQDRVPVRVELIREEFQDELVPALLAGDLVETVDAAIDILYVTFGLLVEMGVNAYPVFAEVQRSNMSKFGEDGMAIIAGPNDPDGIFEGRVKKGPNYFKPNLKAVLLSGEADLG